MISSQHVRVFVVLEMNIAQGYFADVLAVWVMSATVIDLEQDKDLIDLFGRTSAGWPFSSALLCADDQIVVHFCQCHSLHKKRSFKKKTIFGVCRSRDSTQYQTHRENPTSFSSERLRGFPWPSHLLGCGGKEAIPTPDHGNMPMPPIPDGDDPVPWLLWYDWKNVDTRFKVALKYCTFRYFQKVLSHFLKETSIWFFSESRE